MRKLNNTKFIVPIVTVLALLSGVLTVDAAGDWHAEYFNNPTLSGGPVLSRTEAGLDRTANVCRPLADRPGSPRASHSVNHGFCN